MRGVKVNSFNRMLTVVLRNERALRHGGLMIPLEIRQGWLVDVPHSPSPHYNARPANTQPRLLVVHNISLPAGVFGEPYIRELFLGKLNCSAHPSFAELQGVRVSAHAVIYRNGQIEQFVSFDERAWHAGVSEYQGVANCNDFSIGIELEGTDSQPYELRQYQALVGLTQALIIAYPSLTIKHIVGHQHIAPGRKTDPGPAFDWSYFFRCLATSPNT